jgi:hypothetical protein
MKVITACDINFRHMVDGAIKMNAQCGAETLVYNLGGLGMGKPFDITADMAMIHNDPGVVYTGAAKSKCTFKPRIILDAMHENPDEKHFVWVDADGFLIKPVMDVFDNDFDLAFTMRRTGENPHSVTPMFDQYINAGVIFVKNTAAARNFIRLWISLIPHTSTLTDQHAVNELLDKMIKWNIFDVPQKTYWGSVMLLTTDVFNYYYFPDAPHDNARILHFKGEINHAAGYFDQYLAKYLKP